MTQEIERKYLIWESGTNYFTEALSIMYPSIDALKDDVTNNGAPIRQGYLSLTTGRELSDLVGMNVDFIPSEARLRDKKKKFYFTIKGSGGLERNELEVEIEREIFYQYWPQTKGQRVEKIRLSRPFDGHTLEIDVYTDRDLIVAEIEVPTLEEAEKLEILGKDVTTDKRYKNKNLAK